MRKQHIVLLVAIALVAVTVALSVSTQPGTTRQDGEVISRTLGSAEPRAAVSFGVALREGDPVHESSHVFDALATVPGVASASLNGRTSVVEVTYDDQQTDEAALRRALVAVGYIRPTLEDATPAELAEDGSSQSIEIADDHGFSPANIRLQADVPATLVFGPGSECRTAIKLPALGIEADITEGAVIELPALEPGTYELLCGGDMVEGMLFVE